MPTDRLLKDVTAETQENLYVKKNDRVKHNLILIVINKDFTESHWLTGDFLLC